MKAHEFMHEMSTTSAVLGRKHGINLVFEGDRAATDGDTIYLPAFDAGADLTPKQVSVMRGYVDHEAGHLRHSNMERIQEFYDRCMHNGKKGLRDLHNCVEDIWMENKVRDEYLGARENLANLASLSKTKELKAIEEIRKTGRDPLENMGVDPACFGITTVGRSDYGSPRVQDAIDILPDKLKAHSERWAEEARKCKDTEECITLAKSIHKLLEEDPNLESNPEDFDPQSGKGEDEGDNSPEYKEGKKDGDGNKGKAGYKGKSSGKGKGKPQWVETDPDSAINDTDSDCTEAGGIGSVNGKDTNKYRAISTNDDVRYHRGSDKTPKDSPRDRNAVNSDNHHKYEEIRGKIKSKVAVMKSKLRKSLLAKQRRDWDFGKEDGRLDNKRLVAAYNKVPNVYKTRKDRHEEHTAITFLIDLSGSMGGRKSEVTRDCAVAFSECLEGTSYRYNIVGFHNMGYISSTGHTGSGNYERVESAHSPYFKEFDAPLRVHRGAIASIPQAVGGNNSDYHFVLQALNELTKRDESRKVLVVLSDGHPAHAGNISRSSEISLIKKAILDHERKGVECVGIGICDSTVKEIYKDNVVVNDVDELALKVFDKLTKILVGNK